VAPLIAEDHGRPSGVPRDFRTGPNRILNGKNEIERQGRKRDIFSAELKEEAARMVVETSRSIARVARELRVSETTLGYRVRAHRERHAGDEPEPGISAGAAA
jgi:hypothetical protein